MSLYAIGDLHLNLMVDKSMEKYDPIWKNHVKKIEKYWNKRVLVEDTVVITGDHSMGGRMNNVTKDLEFIENLPGRKILLRGNHDLFWKAEKTHLLNARYEDRLFFLQNNFTTYEDYALVGSKGVCYEGKDTYDHFLMIRQREIDRLRPCFEAAKAAGYHKFLMFLHYPPTSVGEQESPFTQLAEEYGVEKVIYSHCHGERHFQDSFLGEVNGVEYSLVSADYLRFKPALIIE
ncbi:MAG: metallophosphoesterase [Lachnospiraceae bacterium]|nr:metallophosphoesterase [Lachnospiraceae bacterium]